MAPLTAGFRQLGRTDLQVFPLCLGGNVFGWTADTRQSFEVLDAYVDAGGNFIDTADQYSNWVDGHVGGESETVIGRWLRRRGPGRDVLLATKVGHMGGLGHPGGLTRASIRRRVGASLDRLGVDHVDVLYAHHDDPGTSLEETMSAFDEIVREGKARHVAASNYTPQRLRKALAVSDQHGWTRFVALQAHYNLLERDRFEGPLASLLEAEQLGGLAYWVLAKGFLTGKYRPGGRVEDPIRGVSDRARQHRVSEYAGDRSLRVLEVLVDIAAKHDVTATAVTLAWTANQRAVTAPIVSARNAEQLADAMGMMRIELDTEDVGRLDAVSSCSVA